MSSDRASVFEDSLRDTARALGMRVRVTHDPTNLCFFIDTALIQQRANYTVDEEMILAVRDKAAIADLLDMMLRELQLKLHDITREQMDKLDVRGRIVNLSSDDKHVLHDLMLAAERWEMSDYSRADAGRKRVDKYRELMSRLFR